MWCIAPGTYNAKVAKDAASLAAKVAGFVVVATSDASCYSGWSCVFFALRSDCSCVEVELWEVLRREEVEGV